MRVIGLYLRSFHPQGWEWCTVCTNSRSDGRSIVVSLLWLGLTQDERKPGAAAVFHGTAAERHD
jgi:hypothetical protein